MSHFTTSHRTLPLGAILFLVLLQAGTPASAQDLAAPEKGSDVLSQDEQAAERIGKVYELLLEQIRAKPSIAINDVELLCSWSERLLQAQLWSSRLHAGELPTGVNKAEILARGINSALDAHVARLRQVAKLNSARTAEKQADPLVASAIESLILLAEQKRAALFQVQRIAEDRKIEITLPEASKARPLIGNRREVFVKIDAEGRYYMTGKQLSLDKLRSSLRDTRVKTPGGAAVVIRADPKVRWQAVVSAMEACNKAGIRDYRITVLDGKSED